MIEKIITFSGKNGRIVLILTALLGLWGAYCLKNIRIDALPDLSPTQVIIFSEWMGRAPDLVEDQITYPIVISMLSAPKVEVVRGFSMFGMSFVYIIFQDGTDIYWARSRTLEYMSKISGRLPPGVTPNIGPDATGVGWILQYVLTDPSGKNNLQQIRTFQDWYLRYWLASVPGVAEVASVGGFEKQYQVEIDPNRLQALNISLNQVIGAIRDSNQDVGGRTLEISEREHYVLGLGYVKNPEDIENVAVGMGEGGVPIRVADLGRVVLGPNIRRGLSDHNGQGDTVGGLIVMRQGEDVSRVLAAVKKRVEEVKGSFPEGIEFKITYDRSLVIKEAIATLRESLIEEILIVSLVILLFLYHVKSAVAAALVLPLSMLIGFIPLYYLGIGLNIMSLGGLILAAGDIVDAVVVLIETSHKKISEPGQTRSRREIVIAACKEVGPSLFSALIVIAVSFLPIFALQAEEGKLFHPLAFTKTFAMIAAALVSITAAPPLIAWFLRKGRIRTEDENPVNRFLIKVYRPLLEKAVRNSKTVLGLLATAILLTGFLFTRLGSEFMPSLWEGSLLYMPITTPGISVTAVTDLLNRQGKAIKAIPEVEEVFGKAGKYDSPTDPSPLSMMEFTIQLKPREKWRRGLTEDALIEELDRAVDIPGLNRAWTKPIRGRIDMLTTGIRTPIGIKVFGKDLKVIEGLGLQIEAALKGVRGTKSVYAERIGSGYYLTFKPNRPVLGRYGLTVGDAQRMVETAIGGVGISPTVEGRERYTINVRYPRELRDNVEKLERVLVSTPTGAKVPMGELGSFQTTFGPPMILDEGGSLVGYVYIDLRDRDVGGYVEEAKKVVAEKVEFPPGYFARWTGQYENLERVRGRLKIVLPLTLILIFFILYISIRSTSKTLLIMASVPLSLIGGVFLMWVLKYNTSVAVWAGAIALIGVAVETCAIMVVFLDQAWKDRVSGSPHPSETDFRRATLEGAQKSLRPVLMAVTMNIFGLLPIMVATGVGADVMKRISSPMFGGLVSLTLLTLFVVPILYQIRESRIFSKKSLKADGSHA